MTVPTPTELEGLLERHRRAAVRVFQCRARRESREHVARSWLYVASLTPLGQADDGQTIKEIAKRARARAALTLNRSENDGSETV